MLKHLTKIGSKIHLESIKKYESLNPQRELRWLLDELKIQNLEIDPNLAKWIKKRAEGTPLAYVIGNQPFIDLSIVCKEPVLIPRWETEEWAIALIQSYEKNLKKPKRILDICTGSGCIAIALAKAFPAAKVDAIDKSQICIDLASHNLAINLKSANNLVFHKLDLFSEDLKKFKDYDLVVCNPPYISQEEYDLLDISVRNFEDKNALLADQNGLAFYQHITKQNYLFAKGARLLYEIGDAQGVDVSKIVRDNEFIDVKVLKDGAGSDRCVSAIKA